MLLLTAALTTLYLLLAAGAATLVARTPPARDVADDNLPQVSILVAARDEEADLPACLEALAAQDYPADRIEFVIIDDHSRDATPQIVRAQASRDARFRLVKAPGEDDDLRGKARALDAGVRASTGDNFLVTDADCRPNPGWARHLAAHFVQDAAAGMVCGVTTVTPRGLLGTLQQIDWLLLLGTASAAAHAGMPLTAMGNNMGVRRSAYEAVGGYPALPFSVTEDYLLFQAVHRSTDYTVQLLAQPELHVTTEPAASLREAFVQRRRWARGGLRAPLWAHLLYGIVFLTHLTLLTSLLIAPWATLPLLGAKLLCEATVVSATARQTGARVSWPMLPVYALALFSYVLVMPLALVLAPRIRWKDRVH